MISSKLNTFVLPRILYVTLFYLYEMSKIDKSILTVFSRGWRQRGLGTDG
jgi:hypothetical protein